MTSLNGTQVPHSRGGYLSRPLKNRFATVFFIFTCCGQADLTLAQDSSAPSATTEHSSLQIIRLDELAKLIERRTQQSEKLAEQLKDAPEGSLNSIREELEKNNRDLANLTTTFELIALDDTDTSLLTAPDEAATTWQQDMLDILNPLIDSMKSITKRPRQIAELRSTIQENDTKLAIAREALNELQSIPDSELSESALARLTELEADYNADVEQLSQEILIAQSQLDRLTEDQQSFFDAVLPATRSFIVGRGLTLVLAFIAAVMVWLLMRLLWWIYETRFTNKHQRRESTWFRVLAYGYYFLTALIIILTVIVVLYVREDLLLLALALLVIAGAVLSFRQFLPRYVREARLLLNLGPVREGERVIFNGLPWRVESINLNSVLRNPSLDGIVRLPLDAMSELISRPVKHNLWFPSSSGDYIILPDGTFGQIRHQTPDLVEIKARGGMSITYDTADFYAINLLNLSRDKTFGVSITFGFDYSLQAISLTEIPATLYKAVETTLHDAGYSTLLKSLIVELSTASASSLDYIVFATMDNKAAGDFYKLERLMQQACIAVSNEQEWTIPFPQLTVHQSTG
ncbi:MAG: hypothetical protein AB8B63_13365 [Granulosicoccus sp.]